MLPGFSGIELCKKIRQDRRKPYSYLTLRTALHDDDELVATA